MGRMREWICRVWRAVRRNARDAELEEELRLHLDLAAEDMQRRAGTTEDPIRAAHLRAGGIPHAMDALRDQRGLPWVADLAYDLRHGVRTLRRSPVFTAVVCVTLAIGIGANTAIFSLVNVLVWRDLPVERPGTLAQFTWQYPGDPPRNMFGVQHYEEYRDRNTVFSDLIGTAPFTLDGAGPGAEPLNTEWVTGNFFQALGVRPALGRLLVQRDADPGAAPVVVVSWRYWNRLDLDPKVLGTHINVGNVSAQVVGVAPREFSGLRLGYRTDVWIPAAAHPNGGQAGFMLMARLKDGVPLDRVRAEMRALDRARIEELGRTDPQWLTVTLDVEPARSGFWTPLHQQFVDPLLMVLVVAGALLLLTCANLGSMLLARAAARQREMAVRVSLGATRFRLVRQVLTESLLLSLAGGLLGIAGAYFATTLLVRIVLSGIRMIGAPPRPDVPMDATVLMFTGAVALVAAVAFGLAPAWTAFASTPASGLRVTDALGASRSARVFGNGLVVTQVAISLVLLSLAGLYASHLSDLRTRDLGFDRASVLLVGLDTARAPHGREQLTQLYKELLHRLEAFPGVRSATLSGMTPISGAAGSGFVDVEGFEEPPAARRRVMLNNVAPGYFATFRTPLVAGRDFQDGDEGGERAAIVNQAMARHYFAGREPLGRELRLEQHAEPYRVVGVVADAKYADLRSPAPQTVYLHAFQQSRLPTQLALRTDVPSATIATDVRRMVDEVLKGVSVSKMTTLTEQLDASIVPERLMAILSGFFGGAAVLLAALGLYGLLAYTVTRRTSEIGVRMALGATPKDVAQLVLKHALSLVCLALAIGTPLAIWTGRVAASIFAGLPAESSLVVSVAAAVTIGIALLAAYVPARRAARLDPLVALRFE